MDSESMLSEGFEEWVKFDLQRIGSFPKEPAVYILRVRGKVEYPKGESDIVYIGATERPFVCRMWEYLNPCANLNSSKRVTARRIRGYLKGKELEVAWKIVPKEEAKTNEKKLKRIFEEKHGKLPLLQKR